MYIGMHINICYYVYKYLRTYPHSRPKFWYKFVKYFYVFTQLQLRVLVLVINTYILLIHLPVSDIMYRCMVLM